VTGQPCAGRMTFLGRLGDLGRDDFGCKVRPLLQVAIMRPAMYVLGLLGAATVLVWVDQSPSDIANQASLLVLMLGAAVLGLAAPRRAWLSALILGGCLAATHAIYPAAGVALPTRCRRPAGQVQLRC
jgi:hypothetical protein